MHYTVRVGVIANDEKLIVDYCRHIVRVVQSDCRQSKDCECESFTKPPPGSRRSEWGVGDGMVQVASNVLQVHTRFGTIVV